MSSSPKNSQGVLAAGQMLGRYELLSPIGRGGMGNVWAARLKGARGFRKLFAVKTILNVSDHPHLEQMLFEEATLASQIQHPNVIETIELGEHDGQLYSVMDLVDGESLSFILRKALADGGVPLAVGVNLVGQVCRGLQAAHDLKDDQGNRIGLVHRDISPPNVLVTYSGTVKIVDFGVAITAASGTGNPNEIKGKVSYFAPEQLRSQPLDARVDIFATGILLYLLTTQRHPFRCKTEAQTINRILSAATVTPPSAYLEDYPAALEAVLLRALEKERDRRYASAAAFLEALEHAMPAAFGPAGDKQVTEYMQGLLGERMLERHHMLRAAEGGAESSSPRASVLSVPAVVSAQGLAARAPRGLSLALTALALTVVGSVATLRNFSTVQAPAHREHAAAAMSPAQAAQAQAGLARATSTVARGGATDTASGGSPPARPTAAALTSPGARVAPDATARAQANARTASAKGHSARVEAASDWPPQAQSVIASFPEGTRELPAPEPSSSTVLAVVSGLGGASAEGAKPSTQAPDQAPALTPSAAANPPIPTKARPLASRLGHARLAINPLTQPYRVKLPKGLQRTDQTYAATLNVCVAASGSVSSVKVVRSAGPVIDSSLSSAVSRWRYRPLLENQRAVPFCYVLRYEFTGR